MLVFCSITNILETDPAINNISTAEKLAQKVVFLFYGQALGPYKSCGCNTEVFFFYL